MAPQSSHLPGPGPQKGLETVDTPRVHPETRAGDPFTSFAPPLDHPHACWHGLIFLTYIVFDEELGEEIEETEAIPCRRCATAQAEG
jgi:hypothetical protein